MTSSFCLLSNVDMGLAASAVLPLSGDRFSQRDLFCGRLLRPTGVCTPLRAKASSTRISSLCNFYCVSLQVHVCYKKPAQERRKASRHLRFLRHVVYPTPSVDQPALTQAHKPTPASHSLLQTYSSVIFYLRGAVAVPNKLVQKG